MTLRVGTVPDTHPYLDAVLPASAQHVRFASAAATGWEPSPLLDPSRRRECLAHLDVVHVHFGYEAVTPAQLSDFVTDVRLSGVGLVVTVHDLRNPHDRDNARHEAHLSILVTAADAVVTLTPGAAADLSRRWSRPVTVAPHPTLLRTPAPHRRRGPGHRTVGLHLKSLRANVVDPIPLVLAVADGVRAAGARLRVDVHEPGAPPALLTALAGVATGADVQVHAHQRFSDDELLDYLAGIDVSVLPYRFGTHSGWLELCRDLGVTVLAPDCGYYGQQWPAAHLYANNERDGLSGESLRRAVLDALAAPATAPADRVGRLAQRDQVRATHGDIYARLAQSRTRAGR